MFRPQNLLRTRFAAYAIVLFTSLSTFGCSGALAEDVVNPDTPVSSEAPAGSGDPNTSVSSDNSAPYAGSAGQGSASSSDGSDAQGGSSASSSGAETGSQERVRTTVSHEQEKKDRLFVDATSIAVAVVLLVIALFLFMSLPKQSKKTGNDSVQ